MDIRFADLILEHGVQLWPYVRLRALYEKNGKKGNVVIRKEDFQFEDIEMLERSGFLKIGNSLTAEIEITLREDNRWLCDPPEIKSIVKKEREEYIPSGLETLAEIVGYPKDWAKNPGKYRKLYFSLTSREEQGIIHQVAEKIKEEEPDWDLSMLLTKAVFNQVKSRVRKDNEELNDLRYRSRGEVSYDEEQPF